MGQLGFADDSQEIFLLRYLGIRRTGKAFSYLCYALMQLRQDRSLESFIWDLTAHHFGRKKSNVRTCVRSEILRAYQRQPERFAAVVVGAEGTTAPKTGEVLAAALEWMERYRFVGSGDSRWTEELIIVASGEEKGKPVSCGSQRMMEDAEALLDAFSYDYKIMAE